MASQFNLWVTLSEEVRNRGLELLYTSCTKRYLQNRSCDIQRQCPDSEWRAFCVNRCMVRRRLAYRLQRTDALVTKNLYKTQLLTHTWLPTWVTLLDYFFLYSHFRIPNIQWNEVNWVCYFAATRHKGILLKIECVWILLEFPHCLFVQSHISFHMLPRYIAISDRMLRLPLLSSTEGNSCSLRNQASAMRLPTFNYISWFPSMLIPLYSLHLISI